MQEYERPGEVVTTRVTRTERKLLEAAAAKRQTFLAHVIREGARRLIVEEFGPEALAERESSAAVAASP